MKDFTRISVRRMTKRFGEKIAVHDLSLEFGKGEFVTFLGPSGCGKSTALNCITGLIPITSGAIYIDDECIDDSRKKVPPERREFGMVFQNYALFPHLTVRDNVAFGLTLRRLGRSEIERRVMEALRLVHLEGDARKFPAQMSGGEQQRVAIARCIVLEPRLLLLDEPLSNLDAKLRIELRYELKALHDRLKVTTIYVTHDQSEALALSDRICVLRSGRVQQVGSPQDIFSRPENLFVAEFVGYKNAWPARIETLRETTGGLEARIRLQGIALEVRLPYGEGDPRRQGIVAAHLSGSRVRTAIRPEDIAVGVRTESNALQCVANLVEYQGLASQVSASFLAPPAEGEGHARIDLRSAVAVVEGERVQAGVSPEKILLFPEGESS